MSGCTIWAFPNSEEDRDWSLEHTQLSSFIYKNIFYLHSRGYQFFHDGNGTDGSQILKTYSRIIYASYMRIKLFNANFFQLRTRLFTALFSFDFICKEKRAVKRTKLSSDVKRVPLDIVFPRYLRRTQIKNLRSFLLYLGFP